MCPPSPLFSPPFFCIDLASWGCIDKLTKQNSVNWYQRNYLYAWTGARLVRDL